MSLMIDANEIARCVVQARCGGATQRCHNIRHIGEYSNAAHSWGVAMLMWYLWPQDFPKLAIYCLSHDVPEGWVGDIPSPTLRHVPGLADSLKEIEAGINRDLGLPGERDGLTPEEHAKLKACDRMEFWLWTLEQRTLGNHFVIGAQSSVEQTMQDMPEPALSVYRHIKRGNLLPKQAGVVEEAVKRYAESE